MKHSIALLFCLTACSLNLEIPDGIVVQCTSDDDCPTGSICDVRNECRSPEVAAKGVPGFDVSATQVTVNESGTPTTVTIRLTAQPASDVTLVLAADDESEVLISQNILTFTPSSFGIAQSVVVSGARDCLADGPITSHVIVSPAVSADPSYSGREAPDIEVITNDDVPSAGITVTPTSGLETNESGNGAQFSVVVACKPTASVSFSLASTDTSEGTISVTDLVFTTDNWAVPRLVNVAGKGDCEADGDVAYAIDIGAVTSDDPLYTNLDPPNVALINRDVAFGRINVAVNNGGLRTTEATGQDTFAVTLTCLPSANVTVPIATADSSEGTVNIASLTFTPANWNQAQSVIVTGVDDLFDDGNITYSVTVGTLSSADVGFNGLNPPDVNAVNEDNDTASVTVSPKTGLQTTEAGGSASFTITLGAVPTSPVSITIASSNTAEGTVTAGPLSITSMSPYSVTVTGVDDPVDDDNRPYTIVLGTIASGDPAFNGLAVDDVTVTNVDNDTAGFFDISPNLYVTEAGTTTSAKLALQTRPLADVNCSVTHEFGDNEIRVGATGTVNLTFSPGTQGNVQDAPVTGLADSDSTPVETVSVRTSCTSTDAKYNNLVYYITAFNIDPAVARRVYVTPAPGYTGAQVGTTANADSICQSNNPVGSGTWRAALANAAAGSVRYPCATAVCNWPFKPSYAYYWPLLDGIMGVSNAAATFSPNDWRNGAPNGSGFVSYGGFWTGLNGDFSQGANCSNWTNTSGTGGIGLERANSPSDGFGWSVVAANCSDARRLLCVEQ